MSFSSYLAHYLLALVCFVSALRPSLLSAMMRIGLSLRLSMKVFFVLTGVSEILDAVGYDGHALAAIDLSRMVALVVMGVATFADEKRVTRRVSNAFQAIRLEFNGLAVIKGAKGRKLIADGEADALSVAEPVIETLQHALRE